MRLIALETITKMDSKVFLKNTRLSPQLSFDVYEPFKRECNDLNHCLLSAQPNSYTPLFFKPWSVKLPNIDGINFTLVTLVPTYSTLWGKHTWRRRTKGTYIRHTPVNTIFKTLYPGYEWFHFRETFSGVNPADLSAISVAVHTAAGGRGPAEESLLVTVKGGGLRVDSAVSPNSRSLQTADVYLLCPSGPCD